MGPFKASQYGAAGLVHFENKTSARENSDTSVLCIVTEPEKRLFLRGRFKSSAETVTATQCGIKAKACFSERQDVDHLQTEPLPSDSDTIGLL
jgi:hypothetical protein